MDLALATCIATVALAIATITLAIFNRYHAKATRQMVVEMRKNRELQMRPCIVLDFDFQGALMNLAVKNMGDGAARDVRFQFEPHFVNSAGMDVCEYPIFKDGISFLAPHKEITQFVDLGTKYFKEAGKPRQFDVTITCKDATGANHYSDLIPIDLSIYERFRIEGLKGVPEHLADLKEEVKKLREDFERWRA